MICAQCHRPCPYENGIHNARAVEKRQDADNAHPRTTWHGQVSESATAEQNEGGSGDIPGGGAVEVGGAGVAGQPLGHAHTAAVGAAQQGGGGGAGEEAGLGGGGDARDDAAHVGSGSGHGGRHCTEGEKGCGRSRGGREGGGQRSGEGSERSRGRGGRAIIWAGGGGGGPGR